MEDDEWPAKIEEKNKNDENDENDEPVFSKNDFFIKTIRCYNKFYKLKKEILVEQVSGVFDQFRLYDVSMCKF